VADTAVISLPHAIDRYVAAVEGAGYSPHTLRAYATRLTDYLNWVAGDCGIDRDDEAAVASIAALQPAERIQSYLAALRRRRIGRRVGVSSQTLSHAYAVLSGFHRWMERTLRLEPNPMRDVLRPRGETSIDNEFRSLTAEQLEELLSVALHGPRDSSVRDLRTVARRTEDHAILALMGLAGLRVSEVCAIDRSDIAGDMLHVIGKGRKRRAVPLVPDVASALEGHVPPAGASHLFGRPTDPSRRIAPYAIEQRVPRLAQLAGIVELRVTPHVLRHTFGSLMLAADPAALIPTRDLMGHESVETTNKYAHTREADRRLALASMQELRARGR
jgi:integrase/recombinase XerC